jgi:hypothetical protein
LVFWFSPALQPGFNISAVNQNITIFSKFSAICRFCCHTGDAVTTARERTYSFLLDHRNRDTHDVSSADINGHFAFGGKSWLTMTAPSTASATAKEYWAFAVAFSNRAQA